MFFGHKIGAAALLSAACAAQAEQVPLGDVFRLNPDEPAAAFSSGPWVMRAPGGGFAATWTQSNSTEAEGSLQFARIYSAGGVPLAPAVPVNRRYDRGGIGFAAGDRSGNFVVVWSYETGAPPAETSGGVYGRRFDAAGAALGDEFEIAPPPVSLSGMLDVSAAPDGRFVVAWYGPEGDDFSLNVRVFDASGAPRGAALRVVELHGALGRPQVLMRDDGSFVLTYACNGSCGGRGDFFTGFLQVFDADGSAAGGRNEVGNEAHVESLDALPDGGFQLVWTQPSADFSERHVYVRRYGADAAPDGARMQIDGGPYPDAIASGVNPRGAGLVTWRSAANDLIARDLNAAGEPDGAPYTVGRAQVAYPGAAVSFDDAGGLLLAWTCEQDGGMTLCGRLYGEPVEPPQVPQAGVSAGNNWVGGMGPGLLLGLFAGAALRRRRR